MRIAKVCLVLFAALLMVACAQQQNHQTHGEPITVENATALNELMTNPDAFVGQTILVEGHVTGRCQGSSCWVSLDTGDPEAPFFVRSADHSFAFPEACDNSNVRIQGVWTVITPEVEEHEHEEGEEEMEEGHVCPEPQYFLDPVGVEIRS